MTLSLKRKAYIVAALMMLAVVASSMSLGQSYFSAERNRVLDARRRAAENASADLESLLGRGLDRLRTVAALPALAYGMQLQERSREQRQIPAWTTLHYLFFESDVFTGGVVLVNRDGLLLWSEPSDISRIDTPYDAWPEVHGAFDRRPGEDHVFVLKRGRGDDEILVGVELRDQQDERVAVLIGSVPPTNAALLQALERGRSNGTGATHLVDGAGAVLATTDRQRLTQRLPYLEPVAVKGPASVGSRTDAGGDLLVATAPLPIAGWAVVTEDASAAAFGDVQLLSVELWAGRVAFTLILLGVLLFVVTSFTRPVEALTAAAQRIRAGDLQTGFSLDRVDELGVLAHALNDMTQGLRRQAAELERTTELAEAASRAKTEFLAKVSHEIRTPMNGVLGMTELLLGTSLSTTQHQFATTIQRSANSLLGLINDILDFSKIEAGKVELERVSFSLRDVVHDVLAMLKEGAAGKQIGLTVDMSGDVPSRVWGDVSRVRQVLTNLAGNAVKFTSEGRVVVRVRVVDRAAATCRVRLEVEDTGIGIAPADRERLFQPFVQSDSSTTRLYGGTGLGLAITRELTGQMGGACGVESELGKGSTFWVELPFDQAPDDQTSRPVPDLRQAEPVPKPGVGLDLTVLLVEDNPINTMLAKTMLGKLGCTVTCATNGLEAVETLSSAAFDLVLMDLQMPVMGGEDATREIRRREGGSSRRVPIVALTASALPGDSENCAAAGMDGLLTKPYTQAQLRSALERWAGARTS